MHLQRHFSSSLEGHIKQRYYTRKSTSSVRFAASVFRTNRITIFLQNQFAGINRRYSENKLGVIWVIESTPLQNTSVAEVLMGDFAVRVFASVKSLKKLHGSAQKCMPDAIVVNIKAGSEEQSDLDRLLGDHFRDIPRAVLVDEIDACHHLKSKVWVYPRRFDPLHLSHFVRTLVRTTGIKSGECLRFKDLIFDQEHFHLVIEPGLEQQSVPPKEAKILKLLMKTPGRPISRQDMSETLWDGLKVSARSLDSHISRLRKRLAGSESQIDSIYGGGYVLK